MNKVFLIGNLTRDPELKETQSGISVCNFGIAVKRRYAKDGEQETDFFNCKAWRGLADNIAQYCTKGKKVAVSGHIEMRQYEGNDGAKKTAAEVVVEEVEFLSQKANDEPKKKAAMEAFDDDEDIPF